MQIFVKHYGRVPLVRLTLDVEASDTVAALKAKIYEKETSVLVATMRLFGTKVMADDERTLADFNVVAHTIVHVLPPPLAGD